MDINQNRLDNSMGNSADVIGQFRGINLPGNQLTRLQGFTLVEMLIALVLSSIIFVSAYQVISNLVQYQVRAQQQYDEDLDRLLTEILISQVIEMGISQYDLYYQAQRAPLFKGRPESVQLISRAYSGRYDEPGHRVYRLYQHDNELTVSYQAYDRDYRSNERFKLATGLKIKELNFEYLSKGGWVDEWTNEKILPDFIRVSIDFDDLKSIEFIRGLGRR